MMKYILVLCFIFLGLHMSYGQEIVDPPPPNDIYCQCCNDDYLNPATNLPYTGQESTWIQCVEDCSNGIDSCAVPIDSGILFLVLSGALLGMYYVSKNKKELIK